MHTYRTLTTTSALLLVLASPALADLTAEQVLSDQLKQMESYGLQVETIGQSRSGDTLTVEGITAAAELPEGSFTFTMGGAAFKEMRDGSVEITYPAEIPIVVKGPSIEGEIFEMSMRLAQRGTRTQVSGIPEDIRYEFTSDEFSILDMEFLSPSEMSEVGMNFVFTMTGLSGVMNMTGTTVRDYTADFAISGMDFSMTVDPAEEDFNFLLSFNAQDLDAKYVGSLAKQTLMGSLAENVLNGNKTNGSMTHGALDYTLSVDSPDGAVQGALNALSGVFDFAMDESGLAYSGNTVGTTLTVGGDMIPFPQLTFKMAESGGRFAMPIVPSEDAQDFAFRMSLTGLEIDPILLSMVDPGQQIPRDPANLVIDTTGEVVMLQDIFDPEIAEQLTGPPGQINSVDINEILLSIAGAELTGNGGFTFNNQGPIPMPAGKIDLMLTGGNTLMDTLVNMGLLPQEQAMGARMMMGLFARPGDGPDTLTSTIEVNEDGSVLANGQRIQ